MTRIRRILAATAIILLAALAPGVMRAEPEPRPHRPAFSPTVEPTLPLSIDLRLDDFEQTPGGARGRLILTLSATEDLRDLALRTVLAPGLLGEGGERFPERLAALPRATARRLVLPLRAARAAAQPIRIEVEFLDAQGRRLRLGQGIDFEAGPAEPGRLHAGAYEVMGTPREQVGP